MKRELLALAERAEAATGADRELDAHVHCIREGLTFVLIGTGNEAYGDICDPGDTGHGSRNTTTRGLLYARYPEHKRPPTLGGGKRGNIVQGCTPPAYTASLDAALSLVPSGMLWSVEWVGHQTRYRIASCTIWKPHMATSIADASTPALALTAACLRARAIAGSLPND